MKPTKFTFSSLKNLEKFSQLEKYFELQRAENEAAKVIQGAWKRTRILLPWRHAVRCQKKAQQIQKMVRGMIARKWVAKWFAKRSKIVLGWQACVRRVLSNIHLRPIQEFEKRMAIIIQRNVRKRIGYLRWLRKLQDLAATRIQALWRGIVDRARSDKMWLMKVVVPIQSMYRKRIALKRLSGIKKELYHAATIVQKNFRNYQARVLLGNKLFNREMVYRTNTVKVLTSEDEFCQEKMQRLMKRLVKHQYREKAEKANKIKDEIEVDIYRKENDLIEFKRQRDILSARAVEQGYDKELDKNIESTRNEITELKKKYLFEVQVNSYECDEVLKDQIDEMVIWSDLREKVSSWRAMEYDERLHMTYQRNIINRRKAKKRAIADEKRKWRVHYFTKDGKPDKKRRPGYPWDPSIYAGAEKDVFSGGHGVDLLAHINGTKPSRDGSAFSSSSDGNSKFVRAGSQESVESTLKQVQLQTYLEQVNMYEQLLQPIQEIFQNNFRVSKAREETHLNSSNDQNPTLTNKPTNPQKSQVKFEGPEDRGWGPMGTDLSQALGDIGAIPKAYSRVGQLNIKKDRENRKLLLTDISDDVNIDKVDTTEKEERKKHSKSVDFLKQGSAIDISDDMSEVESIGQMFRRRRKKKFSYLPALDSFKEKYRQQVKEVSEKHSMLPKQGWSKSDYEHIELDSFGSPVHKAPITMAETQSTGPLSPIKSTQMFDSPLVTTNVRKKQRMVEKQNKEHEMKIKSRAARAVTLPPIADGSLIRSGSGGDSLVSNEFEEELRKRREERIIVSEKKKEKKKGTRRFGGKIQWDLLDQLDGERRKFENEKSFVEYYQKY